MADGQAKVRQETVLEVTAEQIARTYAQAFLDAASEAGKEANAEGAVEELEAFVDEVLHKHPLLESMLNSAFMDHNKREAVLDRLLNGKVSAITLNLLKVLSMNGRIGLVAGVAQEARKLFNVMSKRAAVLVRVASPLDDKTSKRIEQTIRERSGLEPIMRVEVDPELVGGLEVRIEDTVYDGTIRTALAKTHKTMVEQTIEAIESNPERFTLAS